MKMDFPNICPFCGKMVTDINDYIDNHLSKHLPLATFELKSRGVL